MKPGLKKFVVAVLVVGSTSGAAMALDCPKPQDLDGSGATPDLTRQLATRHVLSQVAGIYGSLHQQYPKATGAQLTNYLIAAYCPVVKADSALSEPEKEAKVKEFADKVVSAAY